MAKTPPRPRLIIMVKEPRMGAVKTRLAKDIGVTEAMRFYRGATANLIRRLARDSRWTTVLAVAPDHAGRPACWPWGIERIGQGRGDLGERMERLLRAQAPHPAVLIGSDIPSVTAAHIASALALLRRNDAVLGPAHDGGFWLVGLKPYPPLAGLFRAVRWSTPHALADTLANLSGHKVGFAATLTDVDDLPSYRREAAFGARLAPQPAHSLS